MYQNMQTQLFPSGFQVKKKKKVMLFLTRTVSTQCLEDFQKLFKGRGADCQLNFSGLKESQRTGPPTPGLLFLRPIELSHKQWASYCTQTANRLSCFQDLSFQQEFNLCFPQPSTPTVLSTPNWLKLICIKKCQQQRRFF